MQKQQLQKTLPSIIDLAHKAGEAIMELYKQEQTTIQKEDESPLTLADLRAHKIITEELAKKFPDHGILSEESSYKEDLTEKEYCWIVDPLDGTKEFINQNGEFTVNIALIYKRQPTLGVVHLPAKATTYYAAEGLGAFRKNKNNAAPDTRIAVSDRLEQLTLATSRSHSGEAEENLKKNPKITNHMAAGSSLKGCLVAEGTADLYYRFGPTMEWDTAAMQPVVEEAGGIFRQMDGSPMTYNRKNHCNDKGFYAINREENQFI